MPVEVERIVTVPVEVKVERTITVPTYVERIVTRVVTVKVGPTPDAGPRIPSDADPHAGSLATACS
ncbi:MAG: hypothetical protein F4Y67_01015 [Chloroflexi bacterium]|nr:hypothetical protein [Chloroflexota bacterium]